MKDFAFECTVLTHYTEKEFEFIGGSIAKSYNGFRVLFDRKKREIIIYSDSTLTPNASREPTILRQGDIFTYEDLERITRFCNDIKNGIRGKLPVGTDYQDVINEIEFIRNSIFLSQPHPAVLS